MTVGSSAAAITGTIGTLFLATGIPLWMSAQRELDKIVVTTRLTSDGGSVAVAWRF